MISEIIQITSANILRRALPVIQSDASAEIETNPSFGDSISITIANLLNISKQICDSAKKLTKMVEEEISNKVKLIVTLVREHFNLPSDHVTMFTSVGQFLILENCVSWFPMLSHA